MQGFPTLFAFQAYYPEILKHHFNIPSQFNHYFNSYNKESYITALRKLILGDALPEEVVLLEIKPDEQKPESIFIVRHLILGYSPCVSQN